MSRLLQPNWMSVFGNVRIQQVVLSRIQVLLSTASSERTKMKSNIEIKARVHDPARLRSLAQNLSESSPPETLRQVDTFYNCYTGRLKLRETINQPSTLAQLVAYKRSDEEGPKQSDYSITSVKDVDSLKATLEMSLGVRGMVKKTRTLIMIGQTRLHIDEVEGLGDFMELEVVLKTGQSQEEGTEIANDLMEKLCIHQPDLISGAYMDLLEL